MKKYIKLCIYIIYVAIVVYGLGLVMMDHLNKTVLSTIYIIAMAIFFLICCNSFFVPRVMDNQQMLENKHQMKEDPILWKLLLLLELPVVVCFIILLCIA